MSWFNAFLAAGQSVQGTLRLAYLLGQKHSEALPMIWMRTSQGGQANATIDMGTEVKLAAVPSDWVRPHSSAKASEKSK
ncbi:hypothetical protein PENSUB_8092 [Penicillium subrubescens]|uniref:Uncharacterized protein n=1 Tax=Penicillium subrubescens TaxID=1316194 RepID=A0A1Q5TI34_9EURO|nr:hypothetical protein PENSUB_8092 [Penicillium subrubescens]